MISHHYGTQTVKRGRLYLHRGIERTYTTDLLVEVYLNGLGQGLSR